MLLVQDQYVQNSRKVFDSELQLKKDTSKQVFSESTKEIWEIQSGCEEEILTSGNESEGEENILCADPSDLPEEIIESKRQSGFHRKKNVRFEGADFSYVLDTSETSSLDEYLGIDCGYPDPGHRRSLTLEPEKNHKVRGHFRVPKTKWRTVECSYDKKYGCERRPKSTPERSSGYLESGPCGRRPMGEYNVDVRRKEHRCGRSHHGDFEFDDVACRKTGHRYKLECGDDISTRQRHGDCCDHCSPDESRPKKSYAKMKPTHVSLPSHKHGCYTEPEVKNHRMVRLDSHYDSLMCHAGEERYCQMDDYYDHAGSKNKKKILEAVQEQQEQFSDSTYQVPCSKYSSHTISEFQGKKSLEKLTNSSQSDWLYYSGQAFAGEKVHENPPRIHKMRSRRTRMNKLKNGWKKAFVQTVRDGSRNERVGVIVMGSKGPEFYSKKPPGSVPFRKSKSFLDGAAKSFEVMTIDCKNVFLSSSEPGPRTNYAINDLVSPEDDAKVEEKIAKFSKNVNNIVKSSEEKFYKSLTGSDCSQTKKAIEGIFKGAGEGSQQGDKKNEKSSGDVLKPKYQFHLPPFDSLSPRVPKSLRKPEKKINEESKAMADALNKQAKQYKESQSNREEKFLEELKEFHEFSPKEVSQEKAEPNLSLWSVSESKGEEKEATEEGIEAGKRDEGGKDEMSQTGSAKSNEQISINKQRRKKYYESTTSAKGDNKQGDALSGQTQPESLTPKTKRVSKLSQWSGSPKASFEGQALEGGKETHANLIPASFRDLVENGCAISREESENLQSILNQVAFNAEVCSNDPTSSSSSEVIEALAENKASTSPRSSKSPRYSEGGNKNKLAEGPEKEGKEYYQKGEDENHARKDGETYQIESASRKSHRKKSLEESKSCRSQNKAREGKSKKKIILENKMRLLREALPSIAAENEAAHLKQLKKYIDRFIDRVEASTSSEFRKRKQSRIKSKDSTSTDSSEVRVDARKILDFVSNPFKKISSDVTINIAKKLTDALVQDKSSRAVKNLSTSTKARKTSEEETEEEGLVPRGASSGSEVYEEPEPTYLKQLKKMRNEHLNNIVLEVRRLSELLRFLDRCNRLHV